MALEEISKESKIEAFYTVETPIQKISEKEKKREERYQKIDAFLDNLHDKILPNIIFYPFLMTYKGLKFVNNKITNFFDKYKYNESGTLPEEFFKK